MKLTILILPCTLFFQAASSQTIQKPFLNHIALNVSNLKKSVSFYMNIIGLDTIPEPFYDGKHTWFGIGPYSHLHLIEGAKEISVHDKNNHLCFAVPSVNEFVKKIQKAGIEYESWTGEKMKITTRVDGVKQVYFKDPDGYWIEVNDAKE